MSVIIKVSQGETKKFENAPVGQYTGRIYKIVDQGTHENTMFKNPDGSTKMQRQSIVTVELHNLGNPAVLTSEGKPFVGTMFLTHSLDPRSILTKVSQAAFGLIKYNSLIESQGGVSLKDLIGKCFVCNIVPKKPGSDDTKLDTGTLAELQQGTTVPQKVNEEIFFSLNQEQFNPSVYDTLSDKQKSKIASSPEYKECVGESKAGDF